MLKVDDGKARMVRDRLLPPAKRTGPPHVPKGTRLLAPAVRAPAASLPPAQSAEYAPQLFIFGGFLQSLIGLDAYGDLTGDARGTTLFRAGNGNGKAIVPLSDTGSRSRYSIDGPDSARDQHALLTEVLGTLCRRQGTAV